MGYRILATVLACGLGVAFCTARVGADARQVDEYQWEGVERIVAIGDLHGDYDNYLATLRAAGLVDRKGKWSGGKTHLVQTGDIPDRGPDTGKIIDHLTRLAKQAQRKGGQVHSLIGNHEAMNVYGDLRYVSEGEYEAFVNRNSAALRDRYFELVMQNLEQQDPEGFAALPPDFSEQWYAEHPLGWVEHRQAWDPAWNPDGEYADWVLERNVAIRINDLLFVHGGISGFYCGNSLEWITSQVRAHLRNYQPGAAGLLEDEFGPLWYRGLSGVEPEAAPETVAAILEHHDVRHIVVGHTPTSGVIWPMFEGAVIMIDTGISQAYGGHIGYLESTSEGLFAGYQAARVPLPQDSNGNVAYLEQVIDLHPENPYLRQRLQQLTSAPVEEPEQEAKAAGEVESEPVAEGSETGAAAVAGRPAEPDAPVVPICGTAQ